MSFLITVEIMVTMDYVESDLWWLEEKNSDKGYIGHVLRKRLENEKW